MLFRFAFIELYQHSTTNLYFLFLVFRLLEIFYSFGNVTHNEGLQMLTYARHFEKWVFFNVPHLMLHWESVYKVISVDPWH